MAPTTRISATATLRCGSKSCLPPHGCADAWAQTARGTRTHAWTTGTHTIFTDTHGHTDRCQEHTKTCGCLWGQRNKHSPVTCMQINLAHVPFRTHGTWSHTPDPLGHAGRGFRIRTAQPAPGGTFCWKCDLRLFLNLSVPLCSLQSSGIITAPVSWWHDEDENVNAKLSAELLVRTEHTRNTADLTL